MGGFKNVDLEMDATGPKFRFGLWEAKRPISTFAEKLAATRARLNVSVAAAALARRGIPSIDSTEPCALEHDIDNGYKLVANDEVRHSTKCLAAGTTEAAKLAASLMTSAYLSNQADLVGTLDTIETQFHGAIQDPMQEAVDARTNLRVFHIENLSENEPTHRSLFQWLVSALGVATAEAIVNAFMFRDELGLLPGAGFAFVVGLGFAGIGTFGGIGYSQLRRKQPWRKITGAALLLIALAVGIFSLDNMSDFRTALSSVNVQSALDGPVSASSPFSVLPFLLLNVLGMIIIGAKAVSMFGYLDLRRLRARKEKTEKAVTALVDATRAKGDAVHKAGRQVAESLATGAQANADRVKELCAESEAERAECRRRIDLCADAAVAEHLRFREVVAEIQETSAHERFGTPPKRIEVDQPVADDRLAQLSLAADGKADAMQLALPEALEKVDTAANASRDRIAEILAAAEEAARPGRGSGNVLRFFRR